MAGNDPIDIFKYYEMRGEDDCWPYVGKAWGGRNTDPRPYFQANGRRQIAYRWVYELVNGCTLSPDQLILHSCDNGSYPVACGNPKHMRIGNTQENMDDMVRRDRHGMPATVVRAIRTLLEQGRTQQEVADLYGVAPSTISAIAIQRSHRDVD
jgi:hypothetical protein